ncbi:MAG: aminofutalosine synthase MqnE [Arcobacteraceae bacterium]|nr:aminofutalosine synthase MqnE [Arcobacteraceae bacterium]
MTLIEKLENATRLTYEDGIALYDLDILTLGKYADKNRKERFGKKTYYNVNRHINPTNICKDVCQFCAYSASRKNPQQYTMTHDEIMNTVENSCKNGIKEVHIVSAHNPKAGLQWYLEIFSKIKAKYPHLHVKALTAAEIHFLSEEYNLTHENIIDLMIKNGVDSMPGGGAEIFDETVRKKICGGKVTSDQWIDIHRIWHNKGKQSNATMLFGHIESRADRIDHMIRLRELQDETNGFNAFIPLKFRSSNNEMSYAGEVSTTEDLRNYAVSRIFLDNIPHIKAYWPMIGKDISVISLSFGVDDLDGTIQDTTKIYTMAGSEEQNPEMSIEEITTLIKDAGKIPVERNSIYESIKIFK